MSATEKFVLALRVLGLVISAHFFICVYAAAKLFTKRDKHTAQVMFWLFSALALEAALAGIPVLFQLRAPLPSGFRIDMIPVVLWMRIAARVVLSGATWWAALYLTGITRK